MGGVHSLKSKMHVQNSIKVLSANCQGLRNQEKKIDVLTYFKENKVSILCLQDTHLIENDIPELKKLWDGEIYLSGSKTNSRGVAIFLNNNFEHKVLSLKSDKNGNFLKIVLKLSSIIINLITLYGPNKDSPGFFHEIENMLQEENADYNIICGDFNLVLNPELDTNNYKLLNNPKARDTVLKILEDHDLCDIYRNLHPNTKRYTWRRKNPIKQARLDMFIASSTILDIINKCEIRLSYRSDHSITELEKLLNKFNHGKGVWKFNNSLLENTKYLNLINKIIVEEKQKYAIPLYSVEFLNENYSDIQFTIDNDVFLEMLLLRIRGETIKFATFEKEKHVHLENTLIKDIETLEASEQLQSSNTELLHDKRQELMALRKVKLKGNSVRSRQQWLQEGEKLSKFFCNLENKNFIEKTIKKVHLNDGSIVTDQKDILHHVRKFYANLFQSKDDRLMDFDFEKLGLKNNNKTTANEDLGKFLTVKELGFIL